MIGSSKCPLYCQVLQNNVFLLICCLLKLIYPYINNYQIFLRLRGTEIGDKIGYEH